ncbi:transporter substrate-binding domain-containing protein [Brucella intermedia]|uniref:transporter substrate-binding domain-containing protein n=1 Tax=Brucella intermedia TaxID=94625 RepID=UPI002248DEEF|nr:transporter substrate-binding domain-containing protein [Brucella intermedia]
MQISKTRLTAVALLVTISLVPAVHAEEKQWAEVTVASEASFPPWNLTKADGTLDGYEAELLNYFCDHLKIKCKMVTQSFDGIIPGLLAGKFDAAMSGMSVTEKRQETIAFSEAYGSTDQQFVILSSSPLADLPLKDKVFSLTNDEAGTVEALKGLEPLIKGKTIGVQSASIAASFLNKYLKDVVNVREYKSTDQHDLDLKTGRIDLTLASIAYQTTVSKKPGNDQFILVGPRLQGGILGNGVAVGLRKEDTKLKAMFDEAIEAAKADGTMKKLSEKWFGFDATPKE